MSLRLYMIIKAMKNIIRRDDYQPSSRLDMVIKVIKNNDYQMSLRLDTIL